MYNQRFIKLQGAKGDLSAAYFKEPFPLSDNVAPSLQTEMWKQHH